ncbi:MAG: metal-dependent hydrolase [Bdellovibrionota bacterium]
MDNLSHTIAGFIAAHATSVGLSSRKSAAEKRLRPTLWLASAVANNLPDLDFALAPLTTGKLGYLLHHRGHTHTFLGALPQSLVLFFLFWMIYKRKHPEHERGDWKALLFIVVLGPFLHITMDFWNSYGVHPFWPFDNRWFYGDSVFIVEPWLWISLTPVLFFAAKSRGGKLFFAGVWLIAVLLYFFTGFVPWQNALVLTSLGLWLFGLMSKLQPRTRLIAGLSAAIAWIALSFAGSRMAKTQINALLKNIAPQTQVLDLVLSPYPSNPLCWSLFTVEKAQDNYITRRAVYAPLPKFMGAAECPPNRSTETTVPLRPSSLPNRPHVVWSGEFKGGIAELANLSQSNCQARAFLRFARVIAWDASGPGYVVLSDLRFDRGKELGFSEMGIDLSEKTCPKNLPPWVGALMRRFSL